MSTRSRHEARWSDERSTVTGRGPRSKWWVLPILAAALPITFYAAWRVYNDIDTVTYEVRECAEPLTEDASWADVTAAGCEPIAADAISMVLMRGDEPVEPDRSEGSRLSWDEWAVNSPEHSVQLVLDEPAETIVIAEPTNERVRTALTADSADVRWGGFIGSRGPTEYWVLVSPTS